MRNPNDIPVKDRLDAWLAKYPLGPSYGEFQPIVEDLLAQDRHRDAYLVVRGVVTLDEALRGEF